MEEFKRCPHCGSANTEDFPDGNMKLRCLVCGELIALSPTRSSTRIKARSERINTPVYQGAGLLPKTERMTSHRLHAQGGTAVAIPETKTGSGLVMIPAVSPTMGALEIFKRRGWACQQWEGFDSFAVEARLPRDDGGPLDVFNVTVSTVGPVMTFETILMPLPRPPWLAFREVLNELNLRTNGSICLMRECGVVLSYRLVLRPSEKNIPQDRLMQVLRRLNHDRGLAIPFLEEVARTGLSHLSRIRRAVSVPAAEYAGPPVRFHDLQILVNFTGLFYSQEGQVMCMSKEPRQSKRCPVRLAVVGGAIRAWTLPGKDHAHKRWPALRGILKNLRQGSGKFRWKHYGQILKLLSEMNENQPLLRYVWKDFKVIALASYVPFNGNINGEEFRCYLDDLFRCSKEGVTQTMIMRKAV